VVQKTSSKSMRTLSLIARDRETRTVVRYDHHGARPMLAQRVRLLVLGGHVQRGENAVVAHAEVGGSLETGDAHLARESVGHD
jgi:hypothetical protein